MFIVRCPVRANDRLGSESKCESAVIPKVNQKISYIARTLCEH
jgi:hypothetical protein